MRRMSMNREFWFSLSSYSGQVRHPQPCKHIGYSCKIESAWCNLRLIYKACHKSWPIMYRIQNAGTEYYFTKYLYWRRNIGSGIMEWNSSIIIPDTRVNDGLILIYYCCMNCFIYIPKQITIAIRVKELSFPIASYCYVLYCKCSCL